MMQFIKKHELIPKALSVVVAVLMWMYVVSDQNPISTYKYTGVSVQFTGIERLAESDLSIIEGNDAKIEVQIKGGRDKMLLVSPDKINVMANLATVTGPGEYDLTPVVIVDVDGVSVVSKSPTQIKIKVDRIVSKSIPIRLETKGTAKAGYTFGDIEISPDAVTISGPETILEQIEYAKAEYDISEITRTTKATVPYTLITKEGNAANMETIKLETPAVNINIPVHLAGTIPLIVEIEPINALAFDAPYEISPASISVKGNTDTIEQTNSIDLGKVNVAALLASGKTEITLPIILPNGVIGDDGQPTEATVKFDFSELGSKKIIVPSTMFTVVEGFTYKTAELEIRVFGTQSDLANVTPESFAVSFTSEEEMIVGDHNVPAIVKISEPNVVILDKYKLDIAKEQ